MTICIGMRATDGLVIAADAQESDTYLKREQGKIVVWHHVSSPENLNIPSTTAFTGAGDAGYIDAFVGEFIGRPLANAKNSFKEIIAEKMKRFHDDHVLPLVNAPNPPAIQILIGAHFETANHLYVTERSTVREALFHAAVGVGAHFALSCMGELPGIQDVRRTEILAAYIIALTKDRVEGCGKHTTIVSLHDWRQEGTRRIPPTERMTYVSKQQVAKWEQTFERKWKPRQRGLLEKLMEEEERKLERATPSTAQTSGDQR